MRKRFGPSLYFASDKVIFDAMNHSRVTTELIKELLFDRNIVVSSQTSKYELAQYFSRLVADYFDHKDISEKLGKIAQRERITYTEIKTKVTSTQIIDGLKFIKNHLEADGEAMAIDVQEGRILARIQYEYIDYTEVEFRQVQPKDATIEFKKLKDGKYAVRSTQNKYIDTVLERIFGAIETEIKISVDKTKISLIGHPDPVTRSNFFTSLIGGLENHKVITVTEAYCYKPDVAASIIDEDDEEDDSKKPELEEQPYIEKVSLKGTGVTGSFLISDLYNKGYYLVKAVWRVKQLANVNSDVFEVEAQFGDPKDCTDFSYQVRSAIIYDEGRVTKKKRTPTPEEQDRLFRLIEIAATHALSGLEKAHD